MVTVPPFSMAAPSKPAKFRENVLWSMDSVPPLKIPEPASLLFPSKMLARMVSVPPLLIPPARERRRCLTPYCG